MFVGLGGDGSFLGFSSPGWPACPCYSENQSRTHVLTFCGGDRYYALAPSFRVSGGPHHPPPPASSYSRSLSILELHRRRWVWPQLVWVSRRVFDGFVVAV